MTEKKTATPHTNTAATAPATMAGIENLCRTYAGSRDKLDKLCGQINERRVKAVRSRLTMLKRRVAEVSAARDDLHDALEASPELFARPRTRALAGVKVGYRKMPGALVCDEARTIGLVRKHLGAESTAELVVVTERLDKTALRKLDARTLAKVGARMVDIDDEIVIKAAKGDLDKLVDALLSDGADEEVHS